MGGEPYTWNVYVRFGGRLSETYHRKVAWRRQPSLQIIDTKLSADMDMFAQRLNERKTSV